MTTIWYLTATSGDTPDRIWPVIIPGSDTTPTANSEFVIGINEVCNAVRRASSSGVPLSLSA